MALVLLSSSAFTASVVYCDAAAVVADLSETAYSLCRYKTVDDARKAIQVRLYCSSVLVSFRQVVILVCPAQSLNGLPLAGREIKVGQVTPMGGVGGKSVSCQVQPWIKYCPPR